MRFRFPKRAAGAGRSRAGNPHWRAPGPLSPRSSTGARQSGDLSAINPFISDHVPILWEALIGEFGRIATYLIDNDPAQAVAILLVWKEGVEDEEVSPGRYSHALVQNVDLPRPPRLGDGLAKDGIEYDIVRVDAYPYAMSKIVLQDRTDA